ncbi:unnamed protein product [Absidia cylindrospora]
MAPSNSTETTKKKPEAVSADDFEDDFIEEEVYSDTNDVDDEGTIKPVSNTAATKRKMADVDDNNSNDSSTPSATPKKKKNNKKKKSKDPFHGLKIGQNHLPYKPTTFLIV